MAILGDVEIILGLNLHHTLSTDRKENGYISASAFSCNQNVLFLFFSFFKQFHLGGIRQQTLKQWKT